MTHIAVVGAGIAGLGAALTLQDAGLSRTIDEASNRIGISLVMVVVSRRQCFRNVLFEREGYGADSRG
jgi:protoporphyrinogen oxidase